MDTFTRSSESDLEEANLQYADAVARSIERTPLWRGTVPVLPEKVKTRYVAGLLGLEEQKFIREHVATGNISRIPGTYFFARKDVLELVAKCRRLDGWA